MQQFVVHKQYPAKQEAGKIPAIFEWDAVVNCEHADGQNNNLARPVIGSLWNRNQSLILAGILACRCAKFNCCDLGALEHKVDRVHSVRPAWRRDSLANNVDRLALLEAFLVGIGVR
jgi:hypothetical protein